LSSYNLRRWTPIYHPSMGGEITILIVGPALVTRGRSFMDILMLRAMSSSKYVFASRSHIHICTCERWPLFPLLTCIIVTLLKMVLIDQPPSSCYSCQPWSSHSFIDIFWCALLLITYPTYITLISLISFIVIILLMVSDCLVSNLKGG
jgi:hypothetical protein